MVGRWNSHVVQPSLCHPAILCIDCQNFQIPFLQSAIRSSWKASRNNPKHEALVLLHSYSAISSHLRSYQTALSLFPSCNVLLFLPLFLYCGNLWILYICFILESHYLQFLKFLGSQGSFWTSAVTLQHEATTKTTFFLLFIKHSSHRTLEKARQTIKISKMHIEGNYKFIWEGVG